MVAVSKLCLGFGAQKCARYLKIYEPTLEMIVSIVENILEGRSMYFEDFERVYDSQNHSH